MKKVLLITLLLILFQIKGYSQLVVTDPAATGLLGISNSTLSAMEAMNTKIQKAMEQAEWAKNLKSMKQMYILIETTICTYKNVSVLMTASGGTSNCLLSFHYNMQLINLNAALDMFSLIITNGMSMSSGDRLQVMSQALDKFHKAHNEMASMQTMLERQASLQSSNVKLSQDMKSAYSSKIKF